MCLQGQTQREGCKNDTKRPHAFAGRVSLLLDLDGRHHILDVAKPEVRCTWY